MGGQRSVSAHYLAHILPLDKLALVEVIAAANLLKQEKKITSRSLALVLVHDLLLSGGIQAGDGPVKQALLRHKTRLRSEWQRVKIKRGAKTDGELALADDDRTGRWYKLSSFQPGRKKNSLN